MNINFDRLPNWVNYVVVSDHGKIVYLETIEKGISGRVHVSAGSFSSLEDPSYTNTFHAWFMLPKDRIVAVRPKEKPRKLTEEEVEILQDLNLLDYALTEAGYDMDSVHEDTSLVINVYGEDNQLIWSHDEEIDEKISHVDDFAKVVGTMYKHLGFQCPMTISFDCGSHGSTHKFNDFD